MSQRDSPSLFPGVMISGTFGDILQHRKILREALERSGLHPVDMQNYVVDADDDVISSSLDMVQEGSAYIGLISHRYGNIPDDPRNPEKYSITRMEFEKAQELGRPTIIFVMGDDHYVKLGDVERDPENMKKLEEFRKRAKDGRIYVTFDNSSDFEREALLAIAKLKRRIEEKAAAEPAGLAATTPDLAPIQAAATTEFDPKLPCFNVPFRSKGEGVIGRDGVLDKIRRGLQSDVGTPVGRVVSLVGLGGLGKTQLAVEYAYRYREEYPGGVVWLGANEDIDSQLTSLSEEAKWVSPVSDHKTKLDVALNRIRSRSDCLIVFDNLEDFEHIHPYLPRVDVTPHLLLTSQREVHGIPSIDVDFLDPPNSRALLVREAGGSPSVDDESAIVEILEHLDGLPLAIEMAGAFIKRLQLDWKAYLSQLKERPRRTLKGSSLGSFTNHDPDVFATLRVSERVMDDDPLLRAAVDVLTWSGSSDMGIDLLSSLVNCDKTDLIHSLMTAVNVRLIRKHPRQHRYSLHRLLQLARRENGDIPDFENWQSQIAQRLGNWFEQRREDFSDLAAFEAEFDHLIAWQLRSASISNELNAKLIWLQAYPPYHRGRNQQSHELVSKAASIMEQASSDHFALKASILGDFGYTKHAMGEYHKAMELMQTALDIRRETLGEEHPDTASAYGNLGSTYGALGKHDKALELKHTALEIRRATLGEEHPDIATSYLNLGASYGALGNHDKAMELTKTALEIRRATLGEDHPATASAYGNLGATYGALGNHDKALELTKTALEIRRATLGEEHPDTATAYGNLGNTYGVIGKHDKALELKYTAFEIRRATLGEEHPDIATSYLNLGTSYGKLGKHENALELKNMGLEMRRAILGEDHAETAVAYGNLGTTYYDRRQYEKALELLKRSYQNFKSCFGIAHENTRNSAINVAMCLGQLNRLEEANSLLNEAVHSLSPADSIYKRAQREAKELKNRKNQRGARFTPPNPRRKKKRR